MRIPPISQPMCTTTISNRTLPPSIVPQAITNSLNTSSLNQLSTKYDVRNMRPNEMKGLSQSLYDNGIIGLHELGTLTLVPIEAIETDGGIKFCPMSEQPSNNQKFDYIKDISEALEFAKSRGENYAFFESTLSMLKMLDIARNSSVDIIA